MVNGLFPSSEREIVLQVLEKSVVFLTPQALGNVDALRETAWRIFRSYRLLVSVIGLPSRKGPYIGGSRCQRGIPSQYRRLNTQLRPLPLSSKPTYMTRVFPSCRSGNCSHSEMVDRRTWSMFLRVILRPDQLSSKYMISVTYDSATRSVLRCQ